MSALPAIPEQNSQERNEVTQPATNKLHDDSAATIVIHPTPAPADNDTMDAGAYQEEKKSPAFFSKLTSQVGIASTFFPTKKAFGLLARLNLSSRWGIQAGIDKSHYARVRFHDEDDFRNGRREDFRQSYALTDTQKVTNIDIQYSCVQVPLHVLYMKELTKNVHVVASLGTTLDLRVREIVNYRRPSNAIQDSPNPIRAERNVSTPTFNNAQLSAGVEFSIRKLTLSIAPTYSYQVSNVAYQKYKSTLGGSLRMLYTL
jgi:hypothetical protein